MTINMHEAHCHVEALGGVVLMCELNDLWRDNAMNNGDRQVKFSIYFGEISRRLAKGELETSEATVWLKS